MEDAEIVQLYWDRDEEAVAQTAAKYGAYCRRVAMNLLGVREDAEECVSDAYLAAWNAMPPEKPASLRAWLGRVVRNLSVDRLRRRQAEKRYAGLELLLSELEDSVPDRAAQRRAEGAELSAAISAWLRSLVPADRRLFLRRYWEGEPLKVLASEAGVAPGTLAKRMYRLRLGLKAALEGEGYYL